MIEDIKITFDHLDLSVFPGDAAKELFRDWIFDKILEFEKNVLLLDAFSDKDEYFRLFCLVEDRRNEMHEDIKNFDFAFWIEEYEKNS